MTIETREQARQETIGTTRMQLKRSAAITRTASLRAALLLALTLALASCGGISPQATTKQPAAPPGRDFTVKAPEKPPVFEKKETLDKERAEQKPYQYRIGPGDIIGLKVWRRPELSQERLTVSPDGLVVAPRIGTIEVNGKTPEEVEQAITTKLELLYIKPEVTVQVHEYQNNKAYVLGNVSSPGIVRFTGKGTLLEGLAMAGGVPKDSKMTRCSIIRGNDRVIWIDLQELLKSGNMSLNAPIANNDIIYVPELNDEMVFVMGEVKMPGAIRLHEGMSVLKAVMLAGGGVMTANLHKVFVIRQQELNGSVVEIDLEKLIERGDFSQNYTLMANDIVYVSPTGMASFNYLLNKIVPSLQILNLGTSAAESFGLMQELRNKLWGQEGFVSPSN